MNPAAFVLIAAVVVAMVVVLVSGGVVLVVMVVGRGVEAKDCWDEDGPNEDDEVDEFAKVFIFITTDPSGDASALMVMANLDESILFAAAVRVCLCQGFDATKEVKKVTTRLRVKV